MKINFDAPINDLAGKQMIDEEGGGVTLGKVTVQALLGALPGDENSTGTAKVECGLLAMKIYEGGEQDLRAEQISMIKDRIGRAYTALVVARAWALLDPAPVVA